VPEEYRAASGRVVGDLSFPEGQVVQPQNHRVYLVYVSRFATP
jgi:hypothetical protein